MDWNEVGRKMAIIDNIANSYIQDPDRKMRILLYAPPTDDITEILAEIYALQDAISEIDDSVEMTEMDEAYEHNLKRLRLAYYRVGKDPNSDELYRSL